MRPEPVRLDIQKATLEYAAKNARSQDIDITTHRIKIYNAIGGAGGGGMGWGGGLDPTYAM